VPDRRAHRGPHPQDAQLFATDCLPRLRAAVADLNWLLSRSYAAPSSLKLVGDRYALSARQRVAVARAACADDALASRTARRLAPHMAAGRPLWIDGYNVLTTIEAALAGGVVLVSCDACLRDMASMHGTWRKVAETEQAVALIGQALSELGVTDCRWLLDSPVSNSGRLKARLLAAAAEHGWPWQVELAFNPDAKLAQSSEPVATADSNVLDRCGPWLNLARYIVEAAIPQAWLVDLTPTAGDWQAGPP
jgi:hypothetical protein